MIRSVLAVAALIAFTGAASASCAGHVAQSEKSTPITTAQISTPDTTPAPTKQN